MIDDEIEKYATLLGKQKPNVASLLNVASRSSDGARIAKSAFRAMLRQAGIDPDDADPFNAIAAAFDLGGTGTHLGHLANGTADVVWREDEIPYSALASGSPGGGKTTFIMYLVTQLAKRYTVIIPDLRGDYEALLRVVPDSRLLVFGEFPINLLRGSSRVPPAVFNGKFCEVFTDQLGLYQASRRYVNMILDSLDARRVATGHWYCLLDLLDALQNKKEERGSDEMHFRNRCLARVDSLCRGLGENTVGVEQGIDLEALIEGGSLLVFRMDLERSIQDFLLNWLIAFVYEHRARAEDMFKQKPILIILDEQRSVLRSRGPSTAGEVTNLELLLTRGRALGICFIIAEQVVSEISRAARVTPHLVAAFNTSGPELRTTAELLGLNQREQVEKLQSLGKGECIVSLRGDRCPVPLHVRVPLPAMDRSNLRAEERKSYVEGSLADLLPAVLPRYAGFVQERQEVAQRERDPNRLSRNAWRVFVRIASEPPELIEERCLALRMNRAEEEGARKECVLKGYIREAGTIGRGMKFFELGEKGRSFAEDHHVPVRRFKSGVVHEALLHRIRRGLSKACPSVRWVSPGGATGAREPDAYGLFDDGRAICIEIHYRSKPDYETRKLIDLCSIEHVDMVLLVTPTKKEEAALATHIAKNWQTGVPRRYVLLNATECLANDFDWVQILEKDAS